MTYQLTIVRHGQSTWNLENLFTGWTDVDLTPQGEDEARAAGVSMAAEGITPAILHTSLQLRATRTAELALREMDRHWLPVRRNWRLNERHYGALQGMNKAQTAAKHGEDQVHVWRRSYDTPPPPLDLDDERHPIHDIRYANLAPEQLPATECLKDVVTRMLPYWYDVVVPDLRELGSVLIVAHGNSLRALVKHLEGISDEAIPQLNIPTGVPRVYDIGPDMRPERAGRYLGDADAIAAAAEAVANQAKG